MIRDWTLLPLVCVLAALSGCGSVSGLQSGSGVAPMSTSSCQPAVTALIGITPRPPSIDVPEPICVQAALFGSTVTWKLPTGYAFNTSQDCVTFKTTTPGSTHGQPYVASDGTCNVWVASAFNISASWTYGLHFNTVGISYQQWDCDPTIVNRDFGIVRNKLLAGAINCTAVP